MSFIRISILSLASLACFSCTHSHDTQLLVDLQVEIRAQRQFLKESRAETIKLLSKLESLLKTLVAEERQRDKVIPSEASVPTAIEGITRVSETEVRITRMVATQFQKDPMSFARGARIVPSIKNNKANGFKLYAIRPSSFYTSLGFLNGDTVHRINGQNLTTFDKVVEIYGRISTSDVFEFEITRRGTPIRLKITVD